MKTEPITWKFINLQPDLKCMICRAPAINHVKMEDFTLCLCADCSELDEAEILRRAIGGKNE
jgi:hypothetical protein